MAKQIAFVDGKPVSAEWKTCVLYHFLTTSATEFLHRWFIGVSRGQDGVQVTNLDVVGSVLRGRNFAAVAVAFDYIAITAVLATSIASLQLGETQLLRSGKSVGRWPTHAIGGIGGPSSSPGFIDAASAGTTSLLNAGGGPFELARPEVFEENQSIELRSEIATATGVAPVVCASLLGFEVVAD